MLDFALNARHLEGNLAKEDDVRPKPGTASASTYLIEAAVHCAIFNRRPAALIFAARFGQFSVHVDQALRARPLVQVVDILGTEEEAVPQLGFQPCKSEMRWIRLSSLSSYPPCRVELPYQRWIALPCLRSAHVLDTMACPQPV